ncbi:5',5'''-P-1,P-4-tetraphosphate phosphorylase [Phytophthora cinnamomi]|uniref:5',5'''-P-1,P-4-tetraphosphate phosphorylase n=1 Tax=Phytophthora cinnamomi TaxID=4785 RepID=UPI00355978CA|nr:5',5'''-P-1,P-4-tetraphosphate phosphorylase [Phytophthora cinnamomi]
MLRKSMLDVTQRATQSQALKKITAGYELLPAKENGVRYILWAADAAHAKPRPAKEPKDEQPKAFRDPFAKEHLEQDLFVTQLHGTHNLVLNKFNVVDEHVVLPTIEFAPQEQPLDAADFRAMWTAMQGLDAFAFFNCGFESGASQPHKHMQLMTYPSMKAITGLDMPPLLHLIDQKLRDYPTTETVQLPELPFCHFLHRIDLPADADSEKAAAHVVAIYDKVLKQLNSAEYPDRTAQATTALPVAYNLLLTSSFLFLIPRKAQSFNGIEVNSIGFIGSFFVRNEEQRVFFETHGGPMQLLRQVTFPPTPAQ